MSQLRYSPRYLTQKLRELATEAVSVDDDLNPIDRASRLASVLWDRALGHTVIDPKTQKAKKVEPQQWAIQLVFDRLDGRAGDAGADDDGLKTPLADKISEIGKARLNSIANKVSLPAPPMPRKDESPE